MNTLKKIAAMTILTSAVTAASAQSTAVPERGPIPFAAFDLDGNGVISEQEFNTVHEQRMSNRAARGMPMRGMANQPGYADFDTDGNGQLTAEELAAGQQNRMQKRQSMGMGQGPGMGMAPGQGMGRGMGRNMPAFADFDLDADGYIAEEELYEARNKRISERASQGYPMRGLANAPSFTDIDTDGDGRISPEEFTAHQMQHRQQRMR